MNGTAATLILFALALAFAARRRQVIPAVFIPRDEPMQRPWAASEDGAQMFFVRA